MTNLKQSCERCGNDIVPGHPKRCCKRARDRAYYQKNRQRLLDYQKTYRTDEDNAKKISDRTKKWRKDNQEAINECARSRRPVYMDRIKRYENALGGAISECLARTKMQGCRKRVLESTLVRQDILNLWEAQSGLCALTGIPIETARKSPERLSADRIDASRGYTPDNIQLVCKWVNLAKSVHSNEEFLAVLDDLAGV